jgi:lipoprotein-releasing system permease protein
VRNLSWFVARRYLAARKKGQFLSFITWIALGGITVGVMALIVVLGVMSGMQIELREKILGANAHILVLEHGTALRMNNWETVADSVRTHPRVRAVAPFVLSKVAVLRDDEYAQAADLFGVSLDVSPEDAVTDVEREILQRIDALEGTASGLHPVVVGERLAVRLQTAPGDTLLVISLENVGTDPFFGGYRPVMRQFEVTGTFATGMYEYDTNNMYTSLEAAQDLLGLQAGNRVSGLGVKIDDPWDASAVGRSIRDLLGFRYYVESWIVRNETLFSALKLEKLAMGVILSLIVLVAAFNIVSTLVMVVVDRTSEIGILKSMGMTDGQVLRVFVLQGVAIGTLGTMLGTVLGLLLAWVIHTFEIIQIPPDIYFIDRLPVAIQPGDVLLIIGVSLLISLVATIYPALQASRLQPVEAIKHE